MSDFQQAAVRLAEQQQSPLWLAALREEAVAVWQKTLWPTRKMEHWKYTPLTPLQKDGFHRWAQAGRDLRESIDFIAMDATRLVFINGVFAAEASSELPAGITRFHTADADARAIIQAHLGQVVEGERHLFATLSNAWVEDGVLIYIPRNQAWQKPVYVVHVSTPEIEPAVAQQRVLVVLDEGARGTVVEHYLSSNEQQNGLVNSLTEIHVGENASLHHYRLNLEEENLLHLGGVHVDLHRDGRLRAFTLAQGSRLKRIDYQINHRGSGADLDLQGIYLPRNAQILDYHTNVQHYAPACTTREIFRGIVADASRAVFNGRIYIHPHAQKTLAELSNKNLLTSHRAEVNTKPELEIYADDVKCAHGATISQLNASALYYLQSRGVSRKEAEVMMSFGFINELLQAVAEPAVQDYLLPRLARLFGRDDDFLQRIFHE